MKVWFQNRRTKHKRVVQDGPEDTSTADRRQDQIDVRSEESEIDESDAELDIEDEH